MTVGWVDLLQRYARRVNPLLGDLLHPMQYYWVTAQAEYSTDLVFKSRAQLRDLVPRLLEHSTRSFTAQDVLAFLGRKLHGKEEFRVRRRVRRRGRRKTDWVPLRKSVAYLFRYREISLQCNSRYLAALAHPCIMKICYHQRGCRPADVASY
ncbi:MAG: hypothetical protein ACE5JD_09685 [Candidatus Methylomirabilia bacterium]